MGSSLEACYHYYIPKSSVSFSELNNFVKNLQFLVNSYEKYSRISFYGIIYGKTHNIIDRTLTNVKD